ncbi:MAG: phosphomannomutase/phosphoglucomutase [Planctomycetota bacterium]
MAIDPGIFRQYDIRGLVGAGLDEATVEAVGRAFGTRMARLGRRAIAVGRDVRESSEPFARALVAGLLASGVDAVDVGVVPTPLLYYAIIREHLDGGVMITGSHNPVTYNGLKICEGKLPLYGEEIQDLRRAIEAGDLDAGSGERRELDVRDAYLADLGGRFSFGRRFKVVVDCGNGVGGPVVTRALRAAGHEVVELYTEPDGTFPNHLPDPEVPEYVQDLIAKVRECGADCGFGFDGDADRLGVIDEAGRKISADWLIVAFARDLLRRHPGGIVRYDVKCSDFLDEEIRAAGGRPVMGRTGHSILKREMADLDAVLGGELSGHIVFGRDYYPIDDPIYCALQVLRLMEESGRPCSGLFDGIPRTFATAEIKAPCADDRKFDVVAKLVEAFRADHEVVDVDGARVAVPEGEGWGLVRASNTTANLTIRFESRSEAGLARVREIFLRRLERFPEIDLDPVREAF